MQRKVLDYLYNQGGLTLVAYPGEKEIDFDALQKFALALNAGARFLGVDLSCKYHGSAPVSTDDLFARTIGEKGIDALTQVDEGCGYITPKIGRVSDDENAFRNFFHNIEQIK
jgi:hypothetical protein